MLKIEFETRGVNFQAIGAAARKEHVYNLFPVTEILVSNGENQMAVILWLLGFSEDVNTNNNKDHIYTGKLFQQNEFAAINQGPVEKAAHFFTMSLKPTSLHLCFPPFF